VEKKMEKTRKTRLRTAEPVSEVMFRRILVPLAGLSVCFHLISLYWEAPRLWGIHFLHLFPAWPAWGLTILTLCFFIPHFNRFVRALWESTLGRLAGVLGKANSYLLFALAGLFSIPIFWAARTRLFLLGDGYFKLEALAEKIITATEPLDGMVHQQFQKLLFLVLPNAAPSLAYTIPSVVGGGIFVFLLLVLSHRLGKTGFQKAVIFLVLLSLGSVELFFGYVEAYTGLLIGLTLFLVLSLLCIQGKVNVMLPFLALAVSIGLHVSGIVLLPALLYLVFWKWRRSGRKLPDFSSLVCLAGCTVIIGLAVGKVFLMPGEGNRFGQFLPVVSSTNYGFTMFGWPHLVEFVNQLLLLSPVGLILFPWSLFHLTRPEFRKDPFLNFLLISSLAGLFLIFVYNGRWGNADWDLRAFPALFFTLCGILFFVRWGQGWVRFKHYGIILIAISLYHVVPWVWLNANPKMSLDRYVITAINDKHILSASSGGLWTVGRVLDKAGLAREAENIYRLGMKRNPQSIVYYSLLGNNLYAQGRYDEAITCLEKGLQLEPESQEVRLSLAQNYLKKNELTKAMPYLESLKDELSDDRLFVVIMAKTYMNLDRWADARQVLLRFLAQKPESAEMLGLLGLSYYMLRDKAEAGRLWEKAIELDPNDRNAQAGLRELKAASSDQNALPNSAESRK
jgi:tetratricopeptide (TPR) repeat protein